MSLQSHIAKLKKDHRALDRRIRSLESRPKPDQEEISQLKRQKLRHKDEIESLEQKLKQENRPETKETISDVDNESENIVLLLQQGIENKFLDGEESDRRDHERISKLNPVTAEQLFPHIVNTG